MGNKQYNNDGLTGRHLNVHRCKLKCISRESGCTSKRASHFQQSKHGLDVDEVVVPPCVCFIEAQTEVDGGNKLMLT